MHTRRIDRPEGTKVSNEFLEGLLNEASGGRAKVMTGQQLIDLLAGKAGALRDVLGDIPDCGQEDCPIHGGTQADNHIDGEFMSNLTPERAEELAFSATGGASNALVDGKGTMAALLQNQALLWYRVAETMRTRKAMEAYNRSDTDLEAGIKADAEAADAEERAQVD